MLATGQANESAAVPLTWKGGLIVTKPRTGGLRRCSNHRAIQTASCMGKVCSKVLRRSLAPFFEIYARPDQHERSCTDLRRMANPLLCCSLMLPVLFVLSFRNRSWVRWIERVLSTMWWRKFLLSSQTCWLKRRGTELRSGMSWPQHSRRQALGPTSFACWSIGTIAARFQSMVCETWRVAQKARGQVIRWQT